MTLPFRSSSTARVCSSADAPSNLHSTHSHSRPGSRTCSHTAPQPGVGRIHLLLRPSATSPCPSSSASYHVPRSATHCPPAQEYSILRTTLERLQQYVVQHRRCARAALDEQRRGHPLARNMSQRKRGCTSASAVETFMTYLIKL